MKRLLSYQAKKRRRGFSLVEATLSLGILSGGILTLAPLLAFGLKTARLAQNDRSMAQIAQTLTDEAQQGVLSTGTIYLDLEGKTCGSAQAVYLAQATVQASADNSFLTRMTLRITPAGAPDQARTYALVFPTPS